MRMLDVSGFVIVHVIQDHYPYFDNPLIKNVDGKITDFKNKPILVLRKVRNI